MLITSQTYHSLTLGKLHPVPGAFLPGTPFADLVKQFSSSVFSASLQPRGLQHTRPTCSSPTPGGYPNSSPLSPWYHPLLYPSPPAFNLSQHQGLFQGVSSSHQVAKLLDFHLQDQPFQWIFRNDFLLDGLLGSPWSPRDNTTVQKHQFFGTHLSL